MVIFSMNLEVLGKVFDALTQERDLHFRGAGVRFVRAVCAYQFGLPFVRQHKCALHGRSRARWGA